MAQLRALIAVATHGGFALAARATGLSQPSIHRASRELEQTVGQTLFQRSGRTVHLTPPARRLTHFVRLAIAELRSGLAEIEALQTAGAGHVVIGAMPLARAALIPRVVAKFYNAYDTATVSIIEGPYAELLSGLRNGEIDFLLGAMRDPLPSRDIIQHPLFEDQLIIAGRSDHPLSGQKPNIAALALYPWVISHKETPLRRQWEALFIKAGHPLPPVRVECSSVIAIRGLLLEGDWLTLLSPDQIKVEKRAGIIVEIGEALSNSQRWIGMTTRYDWRPTTAQQEMVELFRKASNPEIE